jgi:hypothetical protein
MSPFAWPLNAPNSNGFSTVWTFHWSRFDKNRQLPVFTTADLGPSSASSASRKCVSSSSFIEMGSLQPYEKNSRDALSWCEERVDEGKEEVSLPIWRWNVEVCRCNSVVQTLMNAIICEGDIGDCSMGEVKLSRWGWSSEWSSTDMFRR